MHIAKYDRIVAPSCLAARNFVWRIRSRDQGFVRWAIASRLDQITQAFERDSGHQMKVEFGLSPVIHKKVIDGEPAVVIIIQPNFIEELVTG